MNRVIDMWAPFLPLPEVGAHFAEHFPEPMLGYLKVFWKQPATMETVRAMQAGRTLSEDDVMKALDDAGIERSLVTGFDETSTAGTVTMPNELVAQIAERHPGRFIPFCGVDILKCVARSGNGGEPIVRDGRNTIRDKVLYGSGWFLLGRPAAEVVAEMHELPIPQDVLEDWLYNNASKLFDER